MPRTPRPPMASIRAAITLFDRAAQDYAFMDAYHPDDRPGIEQEYRDQRAQLERLIQRHLKEQTQ